MVNHLKICLAYVEDKIGVFVQILNASSRKLKTSHSYNTGINLKDLMTGDDLEKVSKLQ